MKERERKWGGLYIKEFGGITSLPLGFLIYNETCVSISQTHLPNLRLGQKEPNAEIKAASSRKRESRVRQKRQESMVDQN